MTAGHIGRRLAVLVMLIGLLGIALLAGGCNKQSADSGTSTSQVAEPAAEPVADQADQEPEDVNWVVYINDDQEHSKGGITYGIAMNLTAKNSTGKVDGPYTGSATARTTSKGPVGSGGMLDASAMAKSTKLKFTLQGTGADAGAAGDDDTAATDDSLAPLTLPSDASYTGNGSITMAASGSGKVTARGKTASGPFGNTSGQPIELKVKGSDVWLTIEINGITWVFQGILKSVPR